MDTMHILRNTRGPIPGTLTRNHKAKFGQLGPVLIQSPYRQPALVTPLEKLNTTKQDTKAKQNRTPCPLSDKSHLLLRYSINLLQE